MKKVLKSISSYVMVVSILALVLGIVFIAYPEISLFVLGILVGSYLVIQGIVMVVLGIKALIQHAPFEGILPGVLSILLGILFLENPADLANFIGIVLGIWLIVHSIGGIKLAVNMRGTGAPWVLLVIVNVIGIIAGGCIIYTPILSSVTFTTALGIVLIVNAVINIIDMIVVKMFVKVVDEEIEELETVVEEAIQEAENTVEPVEATVVENAPAAEPAAEPDAPAEGTTQE
ncbi:MAG: DUF308 domain-containing protein [Clostridia bacterium]|nr:DUF308 domain-containing protein [Clostridia bacterium]